MRSNIYKNLLNDIRLPRYGSLRRKKKVTVENFHYDYKNIGGGSHDVSFTVAVNLGKLNEANDIATMNISPSNEKPPILTRSRREEMMQKLSQQEKKRSIDYQKMIYIVSSLECCIQKTSINTWITRGH